MRKIKSWAIVVNYEGDEKDVTYNLTTLPDSISGPIDDYLTELELDDDLQDKKE